MGIDAVIYADVPGTPMTTDELRGVAVHAQTVLGRDVLWVSVARREHSIEFADGAPIDYWRVHVNTLARYYGPGYTRGPIVEIIAVMRFLRQQWPDAKLYYGGDSTDVHDEWTDEIEKEMWHLLCSHEGRDYFAYGNGKSSLVCDFCVKPITFNMGGGGVDGGYCASCGRHWIVKRDGGAVIETLADYKTPTKPDTYPQQPTVTLNLGQLKAVIASLHEGERPAGAAIELEMMLQRAGL